MSLGNISKRIINNNIRYDLCPCCKSQLLSQVGVIKYSKDISYAGIPIELTNLPELWKCNKCQSWFTQNRISETDSIDLYSAGSAWSSDSFIQSKTQEVIDFFDSLITPDCKVLDIGCANGAFLDYAKQQGAMTFGLEYSRSNLDELELKQHTGYADWSNINESFDLIVAFDVVEHLYDLDSFMDCCFSHLSKDGLLILLTGDINSWVAKKDLHMWWYLRYPEHVLFPSLKYFSSLEKFEIVSMIETYPYRLEVRSPIISFVKKLKARLKSFYLGSFVQSLTRPDHMMVVLKKTK
jgi:2-polyprenyl-3-methyl-5-hydroxy-6-metoxy-1,4-benzoquinol methylase